jgi:transposase InsO family protein
MAEHMRAELVVEALELALHRRPDIGLVHHSDRGGQYVSLIFGQKARDAGIAVSMGSQCCGLRQRRLRELRMKMSSVGVSLRGGAGDARREAQVLGTIEPAAHH